MTRPLYDYISELEISITKHFAPDGIFHGKEGTLRLAREVGYGLADYDDKQLNGVFGSLYSRLFVRHAFHFNGGITLDASEWSKEIRRAVAEARAARQKPLIVNGTPWEDYKLDGVTVHVKREDMACSHPGPNFSKIRGLANWINKLPPGIPVGVLDTFHSHGGWGVSYLCAAVNRPCYVFYPVFVKDKGLRYQQQMAQGLGSTLIGLPAGRSAILYHTAKRRLAEITDGQGIMVPNALKVKETIEASALELLEYTPLELTYGTWVVSVSSGTICAGVVKGLAQLTGGKDVKVIAHMGYSRSTDAVHHYICKSADEPLWELPKITLLDEHYEYKDKVSTDGIPFPCNQFYDAKTWRWLEKHAAELEQPIILWNIGG